MTKSKKISKKEFKKIQQRFECFFEDEDNRFELFNTVMNVASEALPGVDVTNPSVLLNAAANAPVEEEEIPLGVLILIIFFLIFGIL